MAREIHLVHSGNSTLQGREQTFSQERVRLGRRPENDVAFDPDKDRLVSGYHAELHVSDDAVEIKDLDSHNGTFVNQTRLHGTITLKSGDEVHFGESGPVFTVRFTEAAPSPSVETAAPAAAPSPSPVRPKPGAQKKDTVGVNTLMRVVDGATKRERQKSRALLSVVAAMFLVIVGGVVAVYVWQSGKLAKEVEQTKKDAEEAKVKANEASKAVTDALAKNEKNLKAQLNRYEKELVALEGKIGAGESKVARLIVEIQERDRALLEIRKRQDLSESQRKAMLEETQKKLTTLHDQLRKSEKELRSKGGGSGPDWASLVDRYREGIFLCVAQDPETGNGGIGTAFCIRESGLLATNAHVVLLLQKMPVKVVVQNETGKVYPIAKLTAHSGFSGVMSPDVGLIQVQAPGERFPALTLATESELRKLRIGTQLGTLGYPGELSSTYLSSADERTKRIKTALATFKDGWIGRVTNYKMEKVSFPQSVLLQHSASLSGGTSGSPMFTADGKVVALNNGGLTTQINTGGKTEKVGPSAAEIGFAIRVDELHKFLKAKGW